ncbi:MAG: lytic transglycosylase domain-containing protein [Deltaproteobacteria bacterium]|nr:lytic transglycosylase domain-containing protein [Deltaproteobacteria bacterium]
MRTVAILLLALPVLLSSAASAEVKMRQGEGGVPHIYNETSNQRSIRLSTHLREVNSLELKRWIEDHAGRQGLDRRLVQAVIQVESGYNYKARSSKGAMGLMQLMPGTARDLGVQDAYNPEANIGGGARYLRQMLDRFSGNVQLALAAYNAGPEAVRRYGGIPPYRETQNYVRRVLALVEGKEMTIEVPSKPTGGNKPKIYLTRDARNRLVMSTSPPPKPTIPAKSPAGPAKSPAGK